MKKKILIGVVIVIFLISIFIPFSSSKEWVNDSEIYDYGHYEMHYYNIYGFKIPFIKKVL